MMRKDPLTGRWVILAPNRSLRPSDFSPDTDKIPARCPFCPGHEGDTPPEIDRVSSAGNDPDWSVRLVPNSFSALLREGEPGKLNGDFYTSLRGVGAHEVVIETPLHAAQPWEYSDAKIAAIFGLVARRIRSLQSDPRIRYVQYFRNSGAGAGASIRHPHSQILALPVVPVAVQAELTSARQHFERTGRCACCEMIGIESESRARTIIENESYTAFMPFAPRFSHETWILPRGHQHDFAALTGEDFTPLGPILRATLFALDRALDSPPFNLLLHVAPAAADAGTYFHWRIEILPRHTHVAGFEFSTGFHINADPPESAAERLRGIIAAHHAPEPRI